MKGDTMKINIMDYKGETREIEIEDFDNVDLMYIEVISGDEVLTVAYKDGTIQGFDSSNDRMINYYDETYYIYKFDNEKNAIDDPNFLNRKNSYEYPYFHK